MRRARFEDLEGNQRNEQPNPMSIDQGHLVLTDHSLVVQPPSSLSRQRSLHKREDGTVSLILPLNKKKKEIRKKEKKRKKNELSTFVEKVCIQPPHEYILIYSPFL